MSIFNNLFCLCKEYVYICKNKINLTNMKQVEELVYLIIGKKSRKFLCKELGISRPTLDRRLVHGGWLKSEIEIIEKLTS